MYDHPSTGVGKHFPVCSALKWALNAAIPLPILTKEEGLQYSRTLSEQVSPCVIT